MKIVLSTDYFPPYIGGTPHHVLLLANKLVKEGHKVVVVTRKVGPSLTRSSYCMKLEMPSAVYLIGTTFKGIDPPLVDPFLILGLLKHRKLLKTADIVHCHGTDTLSFCLLKRKIGFPLVCTVHDFWPICVRRDLLSIKNTVEIPHNCKFCIYKQAYYPLNLLGESFLLTNTLGNIANMLRRYNMAVLHDHIDRFVAVSDFVKRCLIEEGFQRSKIDVICNWVDVDAIRKNIETTDFTPSNNYHRLIFIGNLHLNKGLHILIRALPLLRKQLGKFVLTVVGEGPHMSYFKTLAHKLGVDDYAKFTGRLPSALFKKFLVNSSALVMPSIWPEPCPTVILEAMALGVPVVAAEIGGIPELVSDSYTGLLFRPGDPRDLCEKVVRLLCDRDRLLLMRERSVERVKEKFDVEVGLKKLICIYEKVMQN